VQHCIVMGQSPSHSQRRLCALVLLPLYPARIYSEVPYESSPKLRRKCIKEYCRSDRVRERYSCSYGVRTEWNKSKPAKLVDADVTQIILPEYAFHHLTRGLQKTTANVHGSGVLSVALLSRECHGLRIHLVSMFR